MPGISEGIQGAKAFDEVYEQKLEIEFRNKNGGKPPESNIVLKPESSNEFRSSVLSALGVGRNITAQG